MSLLLETIQKYVDSINLLFESRYDYLLKNYGTKIANKAYENEEFEDDEDDDLIASHVLNDLETMDPTPNKQYLQWLVLRYIAGNFRLEDNPRITRVMYTFRHYKNRLQQKDINQYKGIADIEDAVDPFLDKPASKRQEKEIDKSQIEKLYEDENTVLLIPKTEAAACFYGKGTRWCTAADKNNMFDEYAKKGNLYILIDKKNNKKYQFHLESLQFMNERDTPVSFLDILRTYPRPMNILKEKFTNELLKNPTPESIYKYALKIIKHPVPENLEKIISKDDYYSLYYARHVLHGRFKLAEPMIEKNTATAVYYAKFIIKGSWSEAEKYIAQSAVDSYEYAEEVLYDRFPEGEKAIATSAMYSNMYARNIILGPWPEGEKAIATNPEYALNYVLYILKDRFKLAEPMLLKSAVYWEGYVKVLNNLGIKLPDS